MPYLKTNQVTKGLIYLSILCVFLVMFRVFLKNDLKYTFLFWNLFLAWVPYGLILVVNQVLDSSKTSAFLVLFFWLLFFPNAPYIITDLLHLKAYSQNIIWFDSLLIFVYALTGLLLGLNSLQIAQQIFNTLFGKTKTWLIIFFIVLLSGFGIYLGRYCRLNSWDLFHRPIWFLGRIFHQFENPLSFKVTLTYGLVIFCLYSIFQNFSKLEDNQVKNT